MIRSMVFKKKLNRKKKIKTNLLIISLLLKFKEYCYLINNKKI